MLIWNSPSGDSGAVPVRLSAGERSRSIAELRILGVDTRNTALVEAMLRLKALCFAVAVLTAERDKMQNEVADLKRHLSERRKARRKARGSPGGDSAPPKGRKRRTGASDAEVKHGR